MNRKYVQGYAVMRVRLDALRVAGSVLNNESALGPWLYSAVVPVRVFTSRDDATSEVKRLTSADASRGIYYFVQTTRIIVPPPGSTSREGATATTNQSSVRR